MMFYPPIFETASASTALTALVGTDPVRVFPFGQAPQSPTRPYVVWQVIGGNPENYLGARPDADRFLVQVDCYGETAASARAVAQALRDAVELDAYVTSFRGETREPEAALYRVSFDLEWITGTPVPAASS